MVRKNEMKEDEKKAVKSQEPEGMDGSAEVEERPAAEPRKGTMREALPEQEAVQEAIPEEAMQEAPPDEEDVQEALPEEEGPSEEVPAGGIPGSDDGLEAEVEILQEDLTRLRDQHLRLAADFENYRKRVSAELASGWVRAQADLAGALLDGLDDLQRVSRFTSEDATLEALIEGVDLVERKLLKALTDAGLQVVDPTGEPFDPNTMEAMMRVPAEEEGQDETVHQVFQKGYLFRDQLVRPARVSVYKDDD
ncbi:MAG: nucleotide exchange factor GrpE [Longimicrobiales bacterium]